MSSRTERREAIAGQPIELVRGASARSLLDDGIFSASWERLWRGCSWATAFQSPAFALTWYNVYREVYEPVFVLTRDQSGELSGLLALAWDESKQQLLVAGGRQAEYQAWLCSESLSEVFPVQAFSGLQASFPRGELLFRYLPPNTPIGWAERAKLTRYCDVEWHRRPLWSLENDQEITDSLRKKSNKSRLKRLNKVGEVVFKRLSGRTELERLCGEIVQFCDIRHEATHGIAPFRKDSFKEAFHLSLMEREGVLHATALMVGDQVGAAHLGVVSKNAVHLGIIVHNPFLAQFSPGKFHLLYLAKLLVEEGGELLDLTPGGDPYKDRFANSEDRVATLRVYMSARRKLAVTTCDRILQATKKSAGLVGIQPEHARGIARKMRRFRVARAAKAIIRASRDWATRLREMRVYSYDVARICGVVDETVRVNAIDDLLGYEPVEGWQDRQRFLSAALARLRKGVRSYTCAENGRLLHYGWLIPRQEVSFVSEVGHEYAFPPNCSCLFDFYTFPEARGRGLYYRTLRRMLADAAKIPGTEKVFITVLADNGPSRHVIEKVGFDYECSLFERIRFGQAARWSSIATS